MTALAILSSSHTLWPINLLISSMQSFEFAFLLGSWDKPWRLLRPLEAFEADAGNTAEHAGSIFLVWDACVPKSDEIFMFVCLQI